MNKHMGKLLFLGFLAGLALLALSSARAWDRGLRVGSAGDRARGRLALVIGNGDYRKSPLRNPVNDARAMARVLRRLGFEVIQGENLDLRHMKRLVWRFGDRLRGRRVGLFYYAGHGMQVNGLNYLIPIGARMQSEREVELEALDVRYVLAEMERAGTPLNLLVLDACRDNPYTRSFRNARAGLASMDAPSGTLIAFATGPGKVAADGQGSHGLFTGELIRYMTTPGLSIFEVLMRTRAAVVKRSGGKQVPWESSSLTGSFYFIPPKEAEAGGDGKPERGVGGLRPAAPAAERPVSVAKADLYVKTVPSGAMVYLDGVRKGRSPLSLEGIPSGRRRLLARKGYLVARREVFLAPDDLKRLTLKLEHQKGRLKVFSDPPEAEVYLDGKKVGVTPCVVETTAGGHKLRLVKGGLGAERKVLVPAEGVGRERLKLSLGLGRLRVVTRPRGAEVWIGGRKVGVSPWEGSVSAGTVRVEARKGGVWHGERRVDLGPFFGRRELQMKLERYRGKLKLFSDPSGAKVFLDGRKVGTTPCLVETTAGEHKLRLVGYQNGAGYEHVGKVVVPRAGKRLRVKLKKKPWPKRIRNKVGMEFVLIPAGSFLMGSPDGKGDEDEHPRHRVEITRPYYMQVTEVTQGQWKSVMGNNPSRFKSCGDDCPVEEVSWNDAQEFIRKLNRLEGREIYRLPTEAEWEYACRAGSKGAIYSGELKVLGENNAPALDELGWYGGNSCVSYGDGYDCSDWDKKHSCGRCGTHPVKGKRPNGWGLYDMLGNVWEWCGDWYDSGYYSRSPRRDPRGPDGGKRRVVRGGSWGSLARDLRSADRGRNTPDDRNNYIGFRVARITP